MNTCISSGRRLIAVKLPADQRDQSTSDLITLVSNYAKWKTVDDLNQVADVVSQAIEDELVRAIRDPARPARLLKLKGSMDLSISRCEEMWRALDVDQELANRLARDATVGAAISIDESGLHVITGEAGAGKSLAAERILQVAIQDALDDPSRPIPIFVNARSLNDPINEYIDRLSYETWLPEVHGAFLVVDGLDEIGVSSANALLSEISAYTNSNPRVTAVVAVRPLPGLDMRNESQELAMLEEQAALALIGEIARRDINHIDIYGWPPSVQEAITRPLFAILLGAELQSNENLHSLTPITLVERLAERALSRSGEPTGEQYAWLEELAVATVKHGHAAQPREMGLSRTDQSRLVDSRLVKSGREGLDFTISLMREWFAAQAIINARVSEETIVAQGTTSDRWLTPLGLAIQSGSDDVAVGLMTGLARQDVGFASLVLARLCTKTRQNIRTR